MTSSTRGQAAVEAVLVAAIIAVGALVVGAGAHVRGTIQPRADAQRPVGLASRASATAALPGTAGGVAEALWRLGIHENGVNRGPWIDAFTDGHAEAWCADFVSWVLRAAGHPLGGGVGGWRIPAVDDIATWFAAHGRYRLRAVARPRPGDVVTFRHGHAGIVVAVHDDAIVTVEGNAGDAVARRVYRDWRRYADIDGFGTVD